MSDEGGAPPKRPRTQGGEEMTASDSKSSIAEGMAQLEDRIASLHQHIQQATREAADVQELFNTTAAAQTPFLAQKWPGVLSALSSAAEGLRGIGEGVKGTCRPMGWAKPPPPRHLGDDLSADVWRGDIYPMLSVCEAVCSARPTSKAHGSQLVDEAFMLKRIDQDLKKHSLTGLVDVERPTPPTATATATATAADTDPPGGPPTDPQPASDAVRRFRYLSASAYALERGGAVWQQMTDFIHLAHKYKLIKTLPLRLSANSLPTAAAFDELPLALAVYKTFGRLLSYKGDSLALERVEEEMEEQEDGEEMEDSDEEEQEGEGDDAMGDGGEQDDEQGDDIDQQQQEGAGGDGSGGQPGDGSAGGVTRQRYRIGAEYFTTVPLSDLPPNHPYRSGYKDSDPVIRSGGCLFPSFTAFLKGTVLMEWCDQEGVAQKLVAGASVGRDDSRYRSLLTAPTIGGGETIDFINEHPPQGYDGRERLIIVKGTTTTDTIVAYLWLSYGDISLLTTEAATEGNSDIERYPIAVNAARRVLVKYGLERTVLA
ncbi:unnamed protein product [Vitrella brassicaformis CCMP3155]|uniref:Uncharacterized protein n=1 Tax=Vitrella brassicaformis (strain CCMP3155) TaxID=1169540 RepID=A0A0G4E8M1_VITBC|nr:unnamed protein product [Vitrella brassicaformis CCMP3155]|eukprot:CEL92170.1 unnamed protein product [Vitrella brassicaformis CCMP3155]